MEELDANVTYTWHYVKCPPENECNNGHHTCAKDSEVCVDQEDGFQCVCGHGYNISSQGCEPVCQQGLFVVLKLSDVTFNFFFFTHKQVVFGVDA